MTVADEPDEAPFAAADVEAGCGSQVKAESDTEAGHEDAEPLSKSMLKEEARMARTARGGATSKERKATSELDKLGDSARHARLNFLIEKSKIYTTILSEKLRKQQEESRAASEAPETPKDASHGPTASPTSLSRQPELVTGGVLKDYQLAGVEWLVSLYENGLNGILADEMGLGKTLQTIAFLAFLRGKGVLGPYLVCAPLSTIANWIKEFKRFTPDLPVVLYHGTKEERETIRRKRLGKVDESFPVVVTSYEIVMNDRKFLQRYLWKYIIVDEGHRLKNLNCRLIRELKAYATANRLLLTGTPLQNNLGELWSLLNFLLPDIFPDLESFQSWFDFSPDSDMGVDDSLVANLHHILKPFLLRRLKVDVEQLLPPKREYLLYAPMTRMQKELYRRGLQSGEQRKSNGHASSAGGTKRQRTAVVDEGLSAQLQGKQEDGVAMDMSELADSTPSAERLKLVNRLMYLRKVCNHPYLLEWPVHRGTDDYVIDDDLVARSGKMILLRRLLLALFDRDHKVLIFSQFTSMLDILEVWAEDIMSWKVCRIDGAMSQDARQEDIERFNNDSDHKLFLLSTRAGGLGINLTSSDTVILFDSDWNPQSDLQAMDRAHRIGQKRPVIVYRFVTASTVETALLEKATNKRKLEKIVISKGQFKSLLSSTKLGHGDLQAILDAEDAERVNIIDNDDDADEVENTPRGKRKRKSRTSPRPVLTDAELNVLLDRSPEAYQRGTVKTDAFAAVETARDADNDALATRI